MDFGRPYVKNKYNNQKSYYNNQKNVIITYVKKEVDVKKDENIE